MHDQYDMHNQYEMHDQYDYFYQHDMTARNLAHARDKILLGSARCYATRLIETHLWFKAQMSLVTDACLTLPALRAGQVAQHQEQQQETAKSHKELEEGKSKAEKECLRLRRARDELAASVLVCSFSYVSSAPLLALQTASGRKVGQLAL